MRAATVRRIQLLTGTCLAAAVLAPWAPACAQDASPFRPERFDEDWSDVSDEHAPFGAQLKNIQVMSSVTVSFGGDARWRLSFLDSPRLGLGEVEADEWLLQRLLLHGELAFEDTARIFVQLGAHDGIGREIPSSTDDNSIDVQQAFFDLNAEGAHGDLTVRTGRQELVLGPRFVTARDSGNVRQRHDLVRVSYVNGPWRADLFGGNPVVDERGAFDDEADAGQDFFGARLQRKFNQSALDVYAYELDRNTAALTGLTSHDDRVSIGGRWYGRSGPIDFDAEAVVQRGVFGEQDVRALGGALDIGWRFPEAAMSPRIGARVTYGSGDSDLSDASQGTFAPPFASGSWFGQNGLASFSNTMEVAALLGLTPHEDVAVNMKLAGVWRAETADYVYAGSTALAGTSGGDDTFVGATPSVSIVWRPNDNITINAYGSYVSVGDELVSRGADDVAYAHLSFAVRF